MITVQLVEASYSFSVVCVSFLCLALLISHPFGLSHICKPPFRLLYKAKVYQSKASSVVATYHHSEAMSHAMLQSAATIC